MKYIDFSFSGRMPFTQDRANYMQSTYTEPIMALVSMFGDATPEPVRISGMEITDNLDGTFSITDGWFMWLGRFVRFTSSTYGPLTGGDDFFVVINDVTSSLTYRDLSVHDALVEPVGTVALLPSGSSIIASRFLLSSMISPAEAFLKNYDSYINPAYSNVVVLNPDPSERLKYRKPVGSKTVTLKGRVYNPAAATVILDTPVTSTALPVGTRPLVDRVYWVHNDVSGDQVPVRVKSSGHISLAGDIAAQPNDGAKLYISFDVD